MKTNINDLPVIMQDEKTTFRNLPGFGVMTVAHNEIPAGADFRPLLNGLNHDSCHCPHWGYVLKGSIRIIYNDGVEELIEANDIFYLPAGHTAIVEKDIKFVEFSQTKEFDEVMIHVGKKMAEMEK